MLDPTDEELILQITASIDAETTDQLRTSIGRAYDSVRQIHDPMEGFNNKTFGYVLYELVSYRLEKLSHTLTENVSLISKAPAFRLRIGDLIATHYNVGSSEKQDINTCLPNEGSTASEFFQERCSKQLLFDFQQHEDRPFKLGKIIIAHLGNPADGLCAIYACIPGSLTESGNVASWRIAHPLWRRGQDKPLYEAASQSLPDDEILPPVKLIPKNRKSRNTNG